MSIQSWIASFELVVRMGNSYKQNIINKISPRLPIDRSILKTYIVSAGPSDLSSYNIINSDMLPDQGIVELVEHDAHIGNVKKSPCISKILMYGGKLGA